MIGTANRTLAILIALCLLFLAPSRSYAEVVRYTDAQGKIHYVDSESKVPPEFRSQLTNAKPLPKINRESGMRFVEPTASASQRQVAAVPAKRVELFVTSWCPYCQQLEAALRASKVTYTRYDIEKSQEGARKYRALGGGGIPITKVGDAVIRGNNPQGVLAALGR